MLNQEIAEFGDANWVNLRTFNATTEKYYSVDHTFSHVHVHIWKHFSWESLFRQCDGHKFEEFRLSSLIANCNTVMALICIGIPSKFYNGINKAFFTKDKLKSKIC